MAALAEQAKRDSASETTGQITPSDDLEKPTNASQDIVSEEDTRPGAKAGLSLSKFWIVMFGYAKYLLLMIILVVSS